MKDQSLRVLIVEDSEDDTLLVLRALKKGGYNPLYERVETSAAMKKALKEKQWDIILCDYKMPKFSGKQAIALLKETNIDIPLIIVSGTVGEETAIECMRSGAHDYVMKDSLSRLCPAIARELEEAEVRNKQRQAENTLREGEEKYRTILENIEDGFYEVDIKGNFTFFNDSMCRILGYSQKEMMGMNNRQFTDKENAKKLFKTFNEVYKTGESTKEFNWQIIRKDGTKRFIEVSVSLQKNSSGKPIGFRGIARDITERKQAEEALRESEEKHRVLIETTDTGYLILDAQGRVIDANKEYIRLTGYGALEEILGRGLVEWTAPYDMERNAAEVKRCVEQGYVRNLEIDYINRSGQITSIELNATVLGSGDSARILSLCRDITDRKRAGEALRRSEKNFRHSLDESPLGVRIVTVEGETIYANRAILDIYGFDSVEELRTTPTKNRYTPQSYAEFKIRREKRKGDDGPSEYELSIVRKNGEIRDLQVFRKEVLWDVEEQFQVIYQDITERKRAEEALRESEEKYRNILENMQEGYFELDLAGNYTFANDAECRNIGYPKEELIGMNNRQYQDETNAQKMYQFFRRLFRTGEPVKTVDVEIIRKNGTKNFNEVSASLIRDAEGKPIGFRGISRDITEHKRAEEALVKSEEKYRTILENIQEGYFEVDLSGNFTFFNDSLCRIIGYSKEELLGMNNRQYTDKEQSKKLFQAFNKVYNTGEPTEGFDWQFIRKDGTKRYVDESVSLQKDSSGKPMGLEELYATLPSANRRRKRLRIAN